MFKGVFDHINNKNK